MVADDVKSRQRVYNFSAGPAVLPESVLRRVQEDLLCLPGVGASVLEISHRGQPFVSIMESAQRNLRQLLSIPDDFEVLFLQGGARLQFGMVPLNLLGHGTADYLVTGSWGKAALQEARKVGETNVVWDGAATKYAQLPDADQMQWTADASYGYYTSNETIEGVQFPQAPDCGGPPLVCDASSDFLSRPVDFARHGMIYACAQKNAGPAGVTVVIIRKDLLARSGDDLPGYLNYRLHAEKGSMFNTPPTFAIYVLDLVAQWLLKDVGGLAAMDALNQQKARMLYDVIDASQGFYGGHAATNCRSSMNVTFRLPSESIQEQFLAGAAQRELCNLKGHRSVGGIRASIYNAMPLKGVSALRDFMNEFWQDQR